jgi:hypothetical protein
MFSELFRKEHDMKRISWMIGILFAVNLAMPAFALIGGGSDPSNIISALGEITNTSTNSFGGIFLQSKRQLYGTELQWQSDPADAHRFIVRVVATVFRDVLPQPINEVTKAITPTSPPPPNFNFSASVIGSNEGTGSDLVNKVKVDLFMSRATLTAFDPVVSFDSIVDGKDARSLVVTMRFNTQADTSGINQSDFVAAVPEPASIGFATFAFIGVLVSGRRR